VLLRGMSRMTSNTHVFQYFTFICFWLTLCTLYALRAQPYIKHGVVMNFSNSSNL
jgi:hypothetical protein